MHILSGNGDVTNWDWHILNGNGDVPHGKWGLGSPGMYIVYAGYFNIEIVYFFIVSGELQNPRLQLNVELSTQA